MMNIFKKLYRPIIATSLLLSFSPVVAQVEDANDELLRLNPEMSTELPQTTGVSRHYSFINYESNHITMNGDSWDELASKLSQTREANTFTVVHIGDSHIQADGNTGKVRSLMQSKFGNAGRGIIVPFRMAGTNEPLDYRITSPESYVKARLLNQPWPTRMGFTGISLSPESYKFTITLSVKSPCGYFTILSSGDLHLTEVLSDEKPIGFTSERTDTGIDVSLDEDYTEFTLKLEGDDVNIFGFDLRNDNNGVLYHSIGNNGAAFASYNTLPGFGRSVASLGPDLIVLSMGTNEAFGTLRAEALEAQIDVMINSIRRYAPDAKFLLVTPSECQRSVYTTKITGKGRKRRKTRVRSYQVNSKVAQARDIIKEYGHRNSIPVYDFYTVAGGAGASTKWLAEKLLNTDRIHRTWEGYRVEGELFYDALIDALCNRNQQKNNKK